VEIELTESVDHAAPQRVGRRTLIGVGVGGAAVSLLPFLSGRAAAKTADGTTTTAPPRRPTATDADLLGTAQQLELTARELYDTALGLTGWSDAETAVVVTIREAHEAFAQSLSGLLGVGAPRTADDALLHSLKGTFSGTPSTALKAAHQLESALVATPLELLGQLQGTDGAALLASVITSEARHTTVVAELAALTDESDLLVDQEAASLLGQG
jgi:hypothetical protein